MKKYHRITKLICGATKLVKRKVNGAGKRLYEVLKLIYKGQCSTEYGHQYKL